MKITYHYRFFKLQLHVAGKSLIVSCPMWIVGYQMLYNLLYVNSYKLWKIFSEVCTRVCVYAVIIKWLAMVNSYWERCFFLRSLYILHFSDRLCCRFWKWWNFDNFLPINYLNMDTPIDKLYIYCYTMSKQRSNLV